MIRQFIVRRRRTLIPFVAGFAALSIALVAAGGSDAAAPDFVFEGGGWGHGVGMSQYGAYGMALQDGAAAEDILAQYYEGTSLAVLGDDLADPEPLWVNLETEITKVDLHAWPRVTGAVPVTVTRGDETLLIAPGTAASIAVSGVDAAGEPECTITGAAGELPAGSCDLDLAWDGWEDLPSTIVTVDRTWNDLGFTGGTDCRLADWNAVPTTHRPCTYGRGTLHVRPDSDTTSFHLVVEIDVDDYVLGISEMPYYWGLPAGGPNGYEALQAQAIAARSYALYRQEDRGDPEQRPWCWCHVYDTTADQRYVGWGHAGTGLDRWIAAVQETAGIVLTHPSDLRQGRLIPAAAFYGSSTYGRTEASASGFGVSSPYLVSVDDSWSLLPGLNNPYTGWEVAVSPASLAARLGWPAGTAVESLEIISCTTSGAVDQIRFEGAGRTDVRRARSLRSLLGLRSAQITNAGAPPPAVAPCPGLDGDRVPVVLGAISFDDDARDDSIGNGDGIAACTERIELLADLSVIQAGGLRAVTAIFATDDPYLGVVFNPGTAYPDLPRGSAAAGIDDWDLLIAPDAPEGYTAGFEIVVTAAEGGPWRLPGELALSCPVAAASTTTIPSVTTTIPSVTTTIPSATTTIPMAGPAPIAPTLLSIAVDDGPFGDSRGNDDRRAACGEVIELRAEVRNDGEADLAGLVARFRTDDPYLDLLYNAGSIYPDLAPGAVGRNRNDWDVAVSPRTPPGHTARITIEFASSDGTTWPIAADLPIGCESAVAPALSALVIDDDLVEDSVGNDDHTAQCGEIIEVFATLQNPGTAPLSGLSATLSTDDPYLRLLYNAASTYPDLAGGAAAVNEADWDFAVDDSAPYGHVARMTLEVTSDEGGPWEVPAQVTLACGTPEVTIAALTIDDGVLGDSVGDLDRIAECGEVIELYAALASHVADLTGVSVGFATSDPYLTLLYNDLSAYPDIANGASAENRNDWDLRVAAAVPPGHVAPFTLSVTSDQGSWTPTGSLTIACTP